MEKIPLGPTSVEIPKIGFGTWEFSPGTGVIQRAVELDAGLVDTAESYGTEKIVGDDISGIRDQIFLATKVSAENLRYDDVLRHAQASLQQLRVDTIDLYQIHSPNPNISITETMRAMSTLVKDGQVRYVGVSNFSVADMKEAQDALGDIPLVSNQVRYNLFAREIEPYILPYCQANNITVIAYSPLAKGDFDGHNALAEVAAETGRTEAQVLLNWVIAHEGVIAIPKTGRVERVEETVRAVGWFLEPDQIRKLETLA